MNWNRDIALLVLAVAAWTIGASAEASCGAAFCTLDTQWSMQGIQTERGTRLDLRYEYINQDRVQTGTRRIAAGEIPRHHDEIKTRNRNVIGTLDHSFDAHWGVSVSLPIADRSHSHIHNHRGARLPEAWDFRQVGDLRLLGRYQMDPSETPDHAQRQGGFYFGVKLPTGNFKVRNGEAALAERTLQPGTGTLDALVGAFWREALPLTNLSWFAQGLLQVPANYREDFRPGNRTGIDLGLRYEATNRLGLLLQANVLFRGRDHGAQAEPADSGGRSVFLSPGVSVAISEDVQAYAFYQVPLYQYVNGVQLVAERSFALGVSMRF